MKELNIEEIKNLISEAVESIKNMFDNLLSRQTNKDNKRAVLLSYWFKDYINYIQNEDNFDPKKLIRYKRGNIIQVEFGYRIGRELGGRHYAVVIDIKNDITSDVITVVPLTSLKDGYNENKFSFKLKTGLYDLYDAKIQKQLNDLMKKVSEANEKLEKKKKEFENKEISLEEYEKYLSYSKSTMNELMSKIDQVNKSRAQLSKLKTGSVLNAGQIITVSKMRISNPKINTDMLYGIKLSQEDLNTLNTKLKELYIFNEKK